MKMLIYLPGSIWEWMELWERVDLYYRRVDLCPLGLWERVDLWERMEVWERVDLYYRRVDLWEGGSMPIGIVGEGGSMGAAVGKGAVSGM